MNKCLHEGRIGVKSGRSYIQNVQSEISRLTITIPIIGRQLTILQWWLLARSGKRISIFGGRSGSAADLADQLRALPLELESGDRVIAAFAVVVEHEVDQAAKQWVAKHARVSLRITDIIAKTDQEEDRAKALRIGCLVLFNALAFQNRLAAADGDVPTVREAWRNGLSGLHALGDISATLIDYASVSNWPPIFLM